MTARRVTDEALQASETRFRVMIEKSYDLYLEVDREMHITWVSTRIETLFGYRDDQVIGRSVLDFVHPDDVDLAATSLLGALSGQFPGVPTILRARHEDGSWIWVEAVGETTVVGGSDDGYVLCIRDITARMDAELTRDAAERERHQAEQLLRASQAQLQAVVQNSGDLTGVLERDGRIVWLSDRVTDMLGYQPDELAGTEGFDLIHPDDQEQAALTFARYLEGGQPTTLLVRLRRADGTWLPTEAIGTTLHDEAGDQLLVNVRDISSRLEAEQALKQSEERFRGLVEHAADAIVVLSSVGTIEDITPGGGLFGGEDRTIVGVSSIDLVHPDDRASAAERLAQVISSPGLSVVHTLRVLAADGSYRWIEAVVSNMLDNDSVKAIIANIRDVTDQVEAEHSAQRLLDIFEATDDLVGVFARNGEILHLNAAARRVFGYGMGDSLPALDLDEIFEGLGPDVVDSLLIGGAWTGEFRITDVRGVRSPVLAQLLAHRDPNGRIEFFSAVLRDISDRKAFEATLEHQATHDPLSGLPNRLLLLDRLRMALAHAHRDRATVGVLFLDLDHFKLVNDSRGHSFGDLLLAAIAERLGTALRPGDTVARFGGDEFVVLCGELRGAEEAVAVAERVQEILKEVFVIDGTEIFVGVSIGISCVPAAEIPPDVLDDDAAENLLREADAAMYRTKERGRGRITIFDDSLRAGTVHRLDTQTGLRRAIERDELELHYQPIFELATDRIAHMEALVRWHHPTRGLLLPGEFIPLAEENGLIIPIGRWVLEHACRQLAAWDEAARGFGEFNVSVNLSGRQLGHPDLLEDLERIVAMTEIDPSRLDLEITESILMDDVELSRQTLDSLKALRVQIAVDDFGTGYSSLSYLKTFPVDYLKIDRSFVAGLGHNDGDDAIAAAIIHLAHTMGLRAVAEGVETPAQLERLRTLGCDLAQGYHLGPPLPATEVFGAD